jgi:hypothetical protein
MPERAHNPSRGVNPRENRADLRTRLAVLAFSIVIFLISACATATPGASSVTQRSNDKAACGAVGTAYMRTTLYLGMTRPSGMVSEPEWQAFLKDEVTPRFPDGLTVLEGDGQWRRADGSIGRERAKVLVILHDEKPATLESLGSLVVRYKEAFTQESVLWETARVCAAF